MSDTTRWDKRAKALRYKWDKASFHKLIGRNLTAKKKIIGAVVFNSMSKIKQNT